jgi:hypothetical protein
MLEEHSDRVAQFLVCASCGEGISGHAYTIWQAEREELIKLTEVTLDRDNRVSTLETLALELADRVARLEVRVGEVQP